MESKEGNNKRLKYAMSYLPFVPIVFLFIESNRSPEFSKHIKYWIFIFVFYIVLVSVLTYFAGFIFIIYLLAVSFLFYKTYNGETVNLEYIDEFETTVKDTLSTDKNNK
jgi:hypothetical protein